jgi:hypothetical protein
MTLSGLGYTKLYNICFLYNLSSSYLNLYLLKLVMTRMIYVDLYKFFISLDDLILYNVEFKIWEY